MTSRTESGPGVGTDGFNFTYLITTYKIKRDRGEKAA
jgi:hypothetical protein